MMDEEQLLKAKDDIARLFSDPEAEIECSEIPVKLLIPSSLMQLIEVVVQMKELKDEDLEKILQHMALKGIIQIIATQAFPNSIEEDMNDQQILQKSGLGNLESKMQDVRGMLDKLNEFQKTISNIKI